MKKKIINSVFIVYMALFAMSNVYAVNCGADIIDIPDDTIRILHNIYVILQIGAPLILVVMGIYDFGRAVMGSSEDDIKKKQHKFIKRLIAAVMVFLILAIVRWVFGILADNKFIDARGCINAILNG